MNDRVLFANSGVQLLCFPLEQELLGHDRWTHVSPSGNLSNPGFEFIQWKILANKLILAVDTTSSDDPTDGNGYFCRKSALSGDFLISIPLAQFGDVARDEGFNLKNGDDVKFVIKPVGLSEGKAKEVDMVVDFGNNRTGAMILEIQTVGNEPMLMTPFELQDRTNLAAAWDDQGIEQPQPKNRWFSSRTHWCTTPFLPAPKVQRVVHEQREVQAKSSLFSRQSSEPQYETVEVVQTVTPETFLNHSMARLGAEAAELGLQFDAGAEGIRMRTGVSSPKRYLWADDKSWLDEATWRMFDPERRHEGDYVSRLQGPLLRFFHENDQEAAKSLGEDHKQSPAKPQYPPRSLMVAAIYELLCQAYSFIHTAPYRRGTGDALRMRQIRSLILSYPTGMTLLEQQCLQMQAEKACEIFHRTLGRQHETRPEVSLSVDEASAVHFAYLQSEMEKVAKDARLWFSIMSRPSSHASERVQGAESENAAVDTSRRRGRRGAKTMSAKSDDAETMAVKIACIDVGGGTSDLTIAKYALEDSAATDTISGEIIHKNGLGTAGDQLVKRLLECIIVPTIAEATGMSQDAGGKMVSFLFGLEVAENARLRFDRINWMNQILVPLAEEYLTRATRQDDSAIDFKDVISPELIGKLHEQVGALAGVGTYDIRGTVLNLRYDTSEFDAIIQEVFGELMHEFCLQIVEHEADVVLLAGQPTKLPELQRIIASLLPLHDARIIPMHQYFAGPKYPYNNEDHRIEDPKSAVVVGTAAKFASEQGHLGGLEFRISDQLRANSYFWGTCVKGHILDRRVWFEPEGPSDRTERITSTELILGRRLEESEDAEATPVYVLKVKKPKGVGKIECSVTIRREQLEGGEETLKLVSVEGKVGDQPARCEGSNANVYLKLQTLADEGYYLDTGALSDINLNWLDQFDFTETTDHV